MTKLVSAAAAAVVVAALASAAPASAQSQRIQVKVGLSGILPDEGARVTVIDGDAKISDEIVPTLQLEYFLTDNISAELLCCIARHKVAAVDTALGRVDLGKISHFPPTVTVKYRWTGMGAMEPYVGAGVNYTTFFDKKLPSGGPVTSISYGDSFGPALQVGADVRLDDRWFVNLDVRKIWINTDVKLAAGATQLEADVDIDPWVVSTAIGYRF